MALPEREFKEVVGGGKVIPISQDVEQPKKTGLFGAAKAKPATKSAKLDKPVVFIKGLETKLLDLQRLKGQISDLKAMEVALTDELKSIAKEKFIELYEEGSGNPNTFLIKDGEGCVMVLPTDKYISIEDEARANELMAGYGKDVVVTDEKFYFNPVVLERNQEAIEELIMNADGITDADKSNMLIKEVKYSVAKGFIDRLLKYGDDMALALADVQPIFMLKNCGGNTMADGGDVSNTAPIFVGSLEETEFISEDDNVPSLGNLGVAYEEGSDEYEQRWEARGYDKFKSGGNFKPREVLKEYEYFIDDKIYFGSYHIEDNKVLMDTCFSNDEEGNSYEVSDSEIRSEVYELLSSDKSDEIPSGYRIAEYAEYSKGGEVYAASVSERKPFSDRNLMGIKIGGSYVVLSYGYYPIFVWNNGVWYENANSFSATTKKQMNSVRPSGTIVKKNTEQLTAIYEGTAPAEVVQPDLKAGDLIFFTKRPALKGKVLSVSLQKKVVSAEWVDYDNVLIKSGGKKVFDVNINDVSLQQSID
jgi:hypothetical protein